MDDDIVTLDGDSVFLNGDIVTMDGDSVFLNHDIVLLNDDIVRLKGGEAGLDAGFLLFNSGGRRMHAYRRCFVAEQLSGIVGWHA